nr:hypothetical protein [Tanacetum cinerariifolium]
RSCLRHNLQSPTLLSTLILNRGGYFREPTRSYQMEVLRESSDDADDEDEDEDEEHLAPADSTVVIPTDELAAISFPPEAKVERLLAMPTPPPSPLTSLSLPSVGERLARCTAPAALPSPPLPLPLHMPPPVDRRDDISKTKMPPRKRLCLSTLGSREVGYGIRNTWVEPTETVPEIAPMTVGEMQQTKIVELQETDRRRQAKMVETLRVIGDMRREMGNMQAELLALREQPRRARQPGGDARAMIDQALLWNSTNRDRSRNSHEDNRRNMQTVRPGFYADFMKCQPLNFKGTEGVIGLTRWIKKMESVFQISGCAIENQVKFATCTLLDAALTRWNRQIRSLVHDAYSMTWEVKENNVSAYIEHFQELTLIWTKFVADETEKIDKYVSGLPDNIYGSMKASKLKTLDETIELASDLMDQKLHTYAERQTNNKRKADDSFRNNHGLTPPNLHAARPTIWVLNYSTIT